MTGSAASIVPSLTVCGPPSSASFPDRPGPAGIVATVSYDGAITDQITFDLHGLVTVAAVGANAGDAAALLHLDQIGGPVEIVCERGVGAVPLLTAIVNLTALGRGALPLHGSAFEHEGTGVVTTGWSKGGNTESLLAFTARGARYVADEWVF